MTIAIRVWFNNDIFELDYDKEDGGIDVLGYQIVSVVGDLQEFLILDFAGREIQNIEDLHDVQFSDDMPGTSNHLLQVNLWVYQPMVASRSCCTSKAACTLDSIIQPYRRIVDTTLQLCKFCCQAIEFDLLVPGDPHQLGYFVCSGKQVVEMGLAMQVQALSSTSSFYDEQHSMPDPIRLYSIRKLLDSAIEEQQILSHSSSDYRNMESRINSGIQTVLVYEDPHQLHNARQAIDYDRIRTYALAHQESEAAEGRRVADDELLIRGLLLWFKRDFFKWCYKPQCDNPSCPTAPLSGDGDVRALAVPHHMETTGVSAPSEEERINGWAGRTELYVCKHCSRPV